MRHQTIALHPSPGSWSLQILAGIHSVLDLSTLLQECRQTRIGDAGGWFSLMLAGIYAVIMLLTGWGNIQKGRFFKRRLIPNLEQFLSIMKPGKSDDGSPLKEQLCVVAPRHKQVEPA